jgi:hypothetical protein
VDQGGAIGTAIRTAERAGLDADKVIGGSIVAGVIVVAIIVAVFFWRIRRIIRDFQRKRTGAA